jgi:hypothetical protein
MMWLKHHRTKCLVNNTKHLSCLKLPTCWKPNISWYKSIFSLPPVKEAKRSPDSAFGLPVWELIFSQFKDDDFIYPFYLALIHGNAARSVANDCLGAVMRAAAWSLRCYTAGMWATQSVEQTDSTAKNLPTVRFNQCAFQISLSKCVGRGRWPVSKRGTPLF